MGTVLFSIGILAILAGIVMFIIALVKKSGWGVIRSLVIGAVGVVLVSVGIGIGIAQEVSNSEPPTPPPTAIEVTAQELYSAYEANQVAADAQYKDKTLKISGTVIEIGKDIFDTPYVMLQGGTTYLESMMGVRCEFNREYESELAQLAKGDTVIIQGEVSSYMVDVLLKDSILIR